MKKILLTTILFLLIGNNVFANSITNPVVKIAPAREDWDTWGDPLTGLFIDHEGHILTTADNVLYNNDENEYENIFVCAFAVEEDLIKENLDENCPKAEVEALSLSLNLALLKIPFETGVEFNFESPVFSDYSPKVNEEIKFKGFGYERYEFTNQMRELNNDSLRDIHETIFAESTGKVVSKKSFDFDENINWFFLTNAAMNLGNSGSPVYNENEELIGITSAYGNGTDNDYYLIPPSTGNSTSYVISSDAILIFFLSMEDIGIPEIDMEFIQKLFSEKQIEKMQSATQNVDSSIFNDIDLLSPYYMAIAYLKENKIINGYFDQTFRPDNELNRAELMKILVEAAGNNPDPGQYKNCFPDVKDDWYAKYVCFAKEKGWINGYPDGSFKPENSVNRAESVKMLMNIFSLYQWRNENWGGFDGYPYGDVRVGEWYFQYIGQAKELGILEEIDGYFYPGDNITRGQISEIIFRLLILLVSTED